MGTILITLGILAVGITVFWLLFGWVIVSDREHGKRLTSDQAAKD
jgi:hypothetical protein